MKKLTGILLSSMLLFGAAACGNDTAQTDSAAPDAGETAQAPTTEQAQESLEDSTSEERRRQLDSDIRAREERDQALGDEGTRSDGDLASQVRSKLEANLPASLLTVSAEEGVVVVEGTVPSQEQFQRIEPLANEIRGVQQVQNLARVESATPQAN